jgi:hypothetical protein
LAVAAVERGLSQIVAKTAALVVVEPPPPSLAVWELLIKATMAALAAAQPIALAVAAVAKAQLVTMLQIAFRAGTAALD